MEPLPAFLHAMGASLEVEGATLVALAPSGVILWVNPRWGEFAALNEGHDIRDRFSVGTSYFDGIAEPLRSYYEGAFYNALVTGEPFEQEYECSTPTRFRRHHLRALPFATEGLLLEHSVVVERAHDGPDESPVDLVYVNEHGLILQCSNCRRVRRGDGTWDRVSSWVRKTPTNASHGICRPCMTYYWGAKLQSGDTNAGQ